MSNARKAVVNRQNSLKSTGPITKAGKATSATNAITTGLFTTTLAVVAGESEAEWVSFRDGIVAGLQPVGPVELELAGRAAHLLWRQRRIVRYEAAVAAQAVLPPNPDEVEPDDQFLCALPVDATPIRRLARTRSQLQAARNGVEEHRRALDLLVGLKRGPEDRQLVRDDAWNVLRGTCRVLGWPYLPDPFDPIVASLGETSVFNANWTADLLRKVLAVAATPDMTPAALTKAIIAMLKAEAGEREQRLQELERQERDLVMMLNAERAAASAAAVLGDDAVVERVARAERHLSRELERVLAMLEQVRAARMDGSGGATVGFVFPGAGATRRRSVAQLPAAENASA